MRLALAEAGVLGMWAPIQYPGELSGGEGKGAVCMRRETVRSDLCYLALALAVFLAAGQGERMLEAREERLAEQIKVPSAQAVELVRAAELGAETETAQEAPAGEEEYPPKDFPLTPGEWTALKESCAAGGVPLEVGLGLIWVESRFDAGAVNTVSGCYGYCQLSPRYFPGGLSPEENIRAGMGYLAEQLQRYEGDLEAALTAYHDGHDTGDRGYARAVLEAAARLEGG